MSNDYLMCMIDIKHLKEYVSRMKTLARISAIPPSFGMPPHITLVTINGDKKPNMRGYKCAYNVDENYFIIRR